MSNIGQIKKRVRFYLQSSQFEQEDQDMLLDELNEARKAAERLHDFEVSLQRVTLSIDPTTGGDLLGVTLTGGHTVKSVQTAYLVSDAGDTPLHHSTKRRHAMKKREEVDSYLWSYRSDLVDYRETDWPSERAPMVYMLGRQVFLDPPPSAATTIALDVYTWWPDYYGDEDTDWFTEHGSDYLKWAAICALNFKTGTFVPRQEGNLSPPEKARDEALKRLISHDNWMNQTARSPSL